MSTYIVFANYTNQGIGNIKDGPNRLEGAKKLIAGMGGEVKGFYLTVGRYDLIAIVEVPDEQTLAKIDLLLNSGGAIRTETVRSFTEDEYKEIITALPEW